MHGISGPTPAAAGLTHHRMPRAQLQAIFHKRATNCRALLQKMTCKDEVFYGSSPLCTQKQEELQLQGGYGQ